MENNLDVNILVQVFSDRVNQLTNDLIIKDAVIMQLKQQIEALSKNDEDTSSVSVDDGFK
jgi:hypothetical protein